jgi:hypothetical protein
MFTLLGSSDYGMQGSGVQEAAARGLAPP